MLATERPGVGSKVSSATKNDGIGLEPQEGINFSGKK